MSKKMTISNAIVGLNVDDVKNFATQLNVLLAADRKAQADFTRAPNEFLADRGISLDIRREFLKDAHITDTSPKANVCYVTCWFTNCAITSITVNR